MGLYLSEIIIKNNSLNILFYQGIGMLEAFVLGFWIIWSSDREVYPLSESLWFTLIAVILRQLTAFDLPIIDTYWMIFNGIIWAFAGLIFSIVGRIDSNFIISCVLAMIAGIGYFQLLQHLPDWLSKFLD